MNLFRFIGDSLHVIAILLLLGKIWHSKSCAGVSGKTQILFALVFTTRYLDLVKTFISIYNSFMKIFFIVATYTTVYLIYKQFKKTYEHSKDVCRVEFLIIPTLALALCVNHRFEYFEVLWTFSIYLEAVAIVPQLVMIIRNDQSDTIPLSYLFTLASYKVLYICNWIYRYRIEEYYDIICITSGVIETILVIFTCFYLNHKRGNSEGSSSSETKSSNLLSSIQIISGPSLETDKFEGITPDETENLNGERAPRKDQFFSEIVPIHSSRVPKHPNPV